MSTLSPRLQVRVQQKQTLTPGLVQMVSLLQLNRLELKDQIEAEMAQNPVLEEAVEGSEELTPEELQPVLEAAAERNGEHPDQSILDATVIRAGRRTCCRRFSFPHHRCARHSRRARRRQRSFRTNRFG